MRLADYGWSLADHAFGTPAILIRSDSDLEKFCNNKAATQLVGIYCHGVYMGVLSILEVRTIGMENLRNAFK